MAEAVRQAERIGTVRGTAIQVMAVDICYRQGRWDDALVHLAAIDPEFSGSEHMNLFVRQYRAMGAVIGLQRSDRNSADAYMRRAAGDHPAEPLTPPIPFYPLIEALAMRAEADGDMQTATALMSARLSAQEIREDCRDDMPYLIHLALAAGDTAIAQAAAAQAETDLARDQSPGRAVTAACCRALLARHGDGLLSAAATYRKFGWLPSCALAFEEAAVALAEAGDTSRARAALTDAVRIYGDLGATWTIRRADARLRPHGIRRGPRSIHRRATTGWAALTPSEEHIARLVAQGQSNPDIAGELFLSRSTVQTHVSNILAKLGGRSRIDIARSVAEHSPVT